MVITSILSTFQKKVLIHLKKTLLVEKYYLAGGTALSEYYLHHRKSEDLDFFTSDEQDLENLRKFAQSIDKIFPLDKIDYQRGFGLFTFFFYPKNEVAKYKIDFGQFPFGTIEPLKIINGIQVESIYDIAVDKAHTISIRPRTRDFIDLYMILQDKKEWTFSELLKKGQEKFEIVVDPFQLGENLLSVKDLSAMPIMITDIDTKAVQKFFIAEAKKLKEQILE